MDGPCGSHLLLAVNLQKDCKGHAPGLLDLQIRRIFRIRRDVGLAVFCRLILAISIVLRLDQGTIGALASTLMIFLSLGATIDMLEIRRNTYLGASLNFSFLVGGSSTCACAALEKVVVAVFSEPRCR